MDGDERQPAGEQMPPGDTTDEASVEQLGAAYGKITAELGKVIVGQRQVVEELMIALLAGGHCLLVGVPGLAKTLMVRTLADTLGLAFNRIQFTPDLMPADITGTEVIQEDRASGQREFKFLKGPVFTNVLLADEINRTPPKTQAALLEAMQEQQVTTGGKRHQLPAPFFVLATQNPIEQEGTYPLPEAQLDRFMFEVLVDYPAEEEEFLIVRQTTSDAKPSVEEVLSHSEIEALQAVVRKVPVADHVIRYAMQFARLTRSSAQTSRERGGATLGAAQDDQPRGVLRLPGRDAALRLEDVPAFIAEYVSWGAGPRASQYLILGAKARAMLNGRAYVSTDDVRVVAPAVLRHRIITNFNAEAEGITPDDVVRLLAEAIPTESPRDDSSGQLPEVFRSADAG